MVGATSATETKRHRVLIVDDDVDIRESLAGMLAEEGFEVETAFNGLEALTAINKGRRPDVILLDLTMPVLDGHQTLAILREQRLLAEIPVIVVSAVSFRLTHGSVANLPKPIQFEKLLELIHQHCH